MLENTLQESAQKKEEEKKTESFLLNVALMRLLLYLCVCLGRFSYSVFGNI